MHLRSWRGYAIIFALPAAGIICALWLHFATNPQNPGELEMSQANIEMLTGNGAGTEIHRRLQRVISTKGPFVIVRGQGALNTVSALKRLVDWPVSPRTRHLTMETTRTTLEACSSSASSYWESAQPMCRFGVRAPSPPANLAAPIVTSGVDRAIRSPGDSSPQPVPRFA